MRHLVACSSCGRQYDATGRQPGSRFRCTCGHIVTIPAPQSHDSSVVRCSACGAPRQKEAENCTYCSSDFTLHEKDLHTICPKCMARVSDRARYCHHCAVPIIPEGTAGEETTLGCPACGKDKRLMSRKLKGGKVAILECGTCAGLWLNHDVFEHLVARAAEEAPPADAPTRATRKQHAVTGPVPQQQGPMYRPCVTCGKLMVRQNYGKRSGVIVDICADHGVWFDADELNRVLQWIREAGLERSLAKDELDRKEAQRLKRTPTGSFPVAGLKSRPTSQGAAGDFLGGLIGILGGF